MNKMISMLAAFQRKTKFSKSKTKESEKKIANSRASQNQLSVKFQSDYPTEIWEKSRSPSPISPRPKNSQIMKMSAFKMDDYSSESSDSSSTSSLDAIVYLEKEKHKKKTKKLQGFQEKEISTDSSSDHSSDCSSLDWPLDETTKRMAKERNRQQHTKPCQASNQTPQTPQTFRYPPTIHVPQEQPHLVCVTANYFPSAEWQAQYQVMPVNCGEYVYVDKQPPRTEDDLSRGAASWVLVRKLGPNLILSPPGFIPRHLTRILDSNEVLKVVQNLTPHPVMNRSANQLNVNQQTDYHGQSNQHKLENCFEPTWAKKLGTNLPYNPSYDLSSSHQNNRINSGVYSLELEDKDSGRGPSSGSEWSASKYGSFAGLDEHELDPDPDQFSEKSRPDETSIDFKIPMNQVSQNSNESSPPNLPPPMKPLSCDITPKLIEKLNCIYIGESKVQFATPLILRNSSKFSNQNSGSDKKSSINWEPYKTITQKDEKKIETFTRV